MTNQELQLKNAVTALRYGLIDWFQFFEICRGIQ